MNADDEKADPPNRFVVFGPNNLELAVAPDGNVVVKLLGMESKLGLTPGIGVMMALTPTEARQFAQALARTADAAEGKPPRS